MASTAAIALTGIVLALRYGVHPSAPWGSDYGKLILVKTTLFALALLAASVNQFSHLRSWHPSREFLFTRGISREIGLELIAVILIFAVAGFLTRLPMPMGG
jgi:putative copper export protein